MCPKHQKIKKSQFDCQWVPNLTNSLLIFFQAVQVNPGMVTNNFQTQSIPSAFAELKAFFVMETRFISLLSDSILSQWPWKIWFYSYIWALFSEMVSFCEDFQSKFCACLLSLMHDACCVHHWFTTYHFIFILAFINLPVHVYGAWNYINI